MHFIETAAPFEIAHGQIAREVVEHQLALLVEHQSLRSSRRLVSFLEYVVRKSLDGEGDQLKERTIGVDVFDREPNYDTSSDHIVRTAACVLRKRLAAYYQEDAHRAELKIDIPSGSYVPQFTFPEPTIEPGNAQTVSVTPREQNKGFQKTIGYLGIGVIAVIGLLLFLVHGSVWDNEVDKAWKAAAAGQAVLINVGASDYTSPHRSESEEPPMKVMLQNPLAINDYDAQAAVAVSAAIAHAGGRVTLLPMHKTTFSDLQQSTTVSIGAFNNQWVSHLQTPLRYQFVHSPDSGVYGILDTKNPNSMRYMIDMHVPYTDFTQDYAIVAHFKSPTTNRLTILIAGLGPNGTLAAKNFVSDGEILKSFSKIAPRGWQDRNYEILLGTQVLGNQYGPPKVLDAYFW